jgi:MHS family citrate/tricarballylate:H+ symporter-like MFS transporter
LAVHDRLAAAERQTPSRAITILRVTSGNFLEMFDFFLFGFFARAIADAFFPVHDPVGRLLLTFVTFGAGFLMRPLGAIVLGAYVDRVGRRKGLIVTLSIMAIGTVLIAVTPTYRQFESVSPHLVYVAPLIVLAGRLAQGFSAGVELGGVSVYLAEIAPPGRRGFYTSWQSASQQVAIMVAALLGAALTKLLTPAEVAAFGWRIPFAIGCLIIPFIVVIRRRLEETPSFLGRAARPDTRAMAETLVRAWRIVGLGMTLVVMTTVSFYLITVYTPTFGRQVLALGTLDTLIVTFAVGLSNFFWLPVMGALSDRVGRKPLLLGFSILAIVTAYPSLAWLAAVPSFDKMLGVELWLSFLYAGYNGAMVAALTEIVPADVRTSGFSLAYSLATALFGGFTPFISEGLITLTADKAAPGLWMTAAAAISLVATLTVYRAPARETVSVSG